MKDEERFCQWKRCKKQSTLIYYNKGLCDKHWALLCEMDLEKAHKTMGITKVDKDTDSTIKE